MSELIARMKKGSLVVGAVIIIALILGGLGAGLGELAYRGHWWAFAAIVAILALGMAYMAGDD